MRRTLLRDNVGQRLRLLPAAKEWVAGQHVERDDPWVLTAADDAIRLKNVRTGQGIALSVSHVHHFNDGLPDDTTFAGWLEVNVEVDLTTQLPTVVPLASGAARMVAGTSRPPWAFRLRQVLDRINPDILRAVDAGTLTQPVVVAQHNVGELQALCREAEAAAVLMMSPNGCVIGGGIGNRIDGHIHDLSEGGPMQGFTLLFEKVPPRSGA